MSKTAATRVPKNDFHDFSPPRTAYHLQFRIEISHRCNFFLSLAFEADGCSTFDEILAPQLLRRATFSATGIFNGTGARRKEPI